MEINLIDIIILLAIGHAFFVGLFLSQSPAFGHTPNKHLGRGILITGIIGLNLLLSKWDFDEFYYFIDFFGDDIPWILIVYVPFFQYFAGSTKNWIYNSKRRLWLHVPFYLFIVLNIVIDMDVDWHWITLPAIQTIQTIVYTLEYYLALVYALFLSIASFFMIRAFEGVGKAWLWKVWGFMQGLILYWSLIDIAELWLELSFLNNSLWIAISAFNFWIAYQGIIQLKLKTQRNNKPSEKHQGKTPSQKAYYDKLIQLFEEDRIHLESTTNRDTIAHALGISNGYLSSIISSHGDKSLSEMITDYRLAHAKQLIEAGEKNHYSFEAIGLEAGFKSKSAFYTAFKNEVGKTPSQYQKDFKKS